MQVQFHTFHNMCIIKFFKSNKNVLKKIPSKKDINILNYFNQYCV